MLLGISSSISPGTVIRVTRVFCTMLIVSQWSPATAAARASRRSASVDVGNRRSTMSTKCSRQKIRNTQSLQEKDTQRSTCLNDIPLRWCLAKLCHCLPRPVSTRKFCLFCANAYCWLGCSACQGSEPKYLIVKKAVGHVKACLEENVPQVIVAPAPTFGRAVTLGWIK